MVGACLSAAGAAYQGVFQNPMASPDILGAAQGAAFGAALGILAGGGGNLISLFAFVSSLLTVALVFFISRRARGKQVLTLILSGIMVSSLFSAGTSFIKLVADPANQLPSITYWLMGSLSGAGMSNVAFLAVSMLVGLTPLMLLRWRLNLLSLSDDEAKSMGINTGAIRLVVIAAATFITAASVSVSGMIGWVGLVIPHLCRRLVGNDYKYLIPASVLFGAVFLLIVDNVSRNLLASEIPIGILTAFVGAPFFLWLITRRGESR
jgi:iron complex transport system permease protein